MMVWFEVKYDGILIMKLVEYILKYNIMVHYIMWYYYNNYDDTLS